MALGVLDAVRSPVRGMEEAAGRGALPGFVVVALWAAASLLLAGLGLVIGGFASVDRALESLPPGAVPQNLNEQSLQRLAVVFQIIGIGLRVLWPFVYWAALTLVMHLVTRLLGGEGALSGMFGAMGVACVPFVISTLLQFPILGGYAAFGATAGGAVLSVVDPLLTVGFLVWHVALVVVGAGIARGISYGRAGGSCAISLAAVVGFPIVLLVLLAVLAAIFGGAGG